MRCFIPFLILRRADLGLVDDNNLYEWEVMIIGYVVSIPPERDQVDLNNPYTS